VTVACPLCGAGAEPVLSAPDRLGVASGVFEIHRCRGCGQVFTWPIASDAELSAYYPPDYWGERDEPEPSWIARNQREKTELVSRVRPQGGRLLDVGCGAGYFLRALAADRWDRQGVEISSAGASAAERHIGPGRVHVGRLLEAGLQESSFDVVTFWASLEHMPNPQENLVIARDILVDSGLVIVQVPNFDSYQARYFGPDWFALDLPRHRFHFTVATLTKLLKRAGFEVQRVGYRSPNHDPHALKHSLKSRWFGSALGRVAYYGAAPFLGAVDWIAGGATLTVIAEKTGDRTT
jgi:SAM-dependent methyltransferase